MAREIARRPDVSTANMNFLLLCLGYTLAETRKSVHCTRLFWVGPNYDLIFHNSKFTSSYAGEISLQRRFLIVDILFRFGDYSRSKSKVARNRAEFWRFFKIAPPSNFRGGSQILGPGL